MRCWVVLLMLAVASSVAGGCATSPDETSSIPWNRPQKWEGQGALGGFSPANQGGY